MKAITVHPGSKQIRLVDHPEPAHETPQDVTLRVLEVGVCGTDKEICQFQYGTPPEGESYLVIGHECVGEVLEVGPEVEGLEVGDVVVPMVRRPCGEASCTACSMGRQDYCQTDAFSERGIRGRHGFMTERVVDQARYMNHVPRRLRDVAVLVEPLTIAEKALEQLRCVQRRLPWIAEDPARLADGAHAMVLGAGPVGLLGAMALLVAGFRVTIVSRSPKPNDKADLAEQIGATYVSSKEQSTAEIVEEHGRADVVYEAVGLSAPTFELASALGPNGAFVLTGVPAQHGGGHADLDRLMRAMVLGNQVLVGTVNAAPSSFSEAIRDLGIFLDRWPDATRSLLTGRTPIEGHREVLLGDGGIKNTIAIGL